MAPIYKKRVRLESSGLLLAAMDPQSQIPSSGQETVTEANAITVADKLPCATVGMVYNYLDTHTGREHGEGIYIQGTHSWVQSLGIRAHSTIRC